MKVLLGLGLLLIINVQSTTSILNWSKRATAAELSVFIDALNDFRQKIAKSYQVSNMIEIKYDVDLENQAKMIKSCDEAQGRKNFLPYLPPDADTWEKVEQYQLENAQERIKQKRPDDLMKFGFAVLVVQQLMHPLQSKIGCWELSKPCTARLDDVSEGRYNIDSIEYDTICLLGPVSDVSGSTVSKGDAGSSCSAVGKKDGLCKSDGAHVDFSFNGEDGGGGNTAQVASFLIVFASVLLSMNCL